MMAIWMFWVANGTFQVWRNVGNGTFTNYATIPAGPSVAVVGDYDNDGYLDILTAGGSSSTPTAQVWRNLHNGTFTNTATVPGGNQGGSLAWADFNGDSLLDFLVTGTQGQDSNANPIEVAIIYQNISGSPSNAPPTAPTNLTALVMGGGVKMMWGAATDDHTPASGLNYNVRVGSVSDGVDIVSPESDPVTGQRRVVQIGNAQERLFSLLTNLCGGTYYWSVQAIDTAFAGGAFAAESTFVIPPSISGWTNQSNGQFQVAFNALNGSSYTLQSSSNLVQWVSVTKPFIAGANRGPPQAR